MRALRPEIAQPRGRRKGLGGDIGSGLYFTKNSCLPNSVILSPSKVLPYPTTQVFLCHRAQDTNEKVEE